MNISVSAFLNALKVMGLGMAGIFIVTVIIICAVTLLNKLGSRKDSDGNGNS